MLQASVTFDPVEKNKRYAHNEDSYNKRSLPHADEYSEARRHCPASRSCDSTAKNLRCGMLSLGIVSVAARAIRPMKNGAFIRNAAEFLWELPEAGHFDGAYSKMLVNPAAGGAQHVDYRISSYQPKGHVAPHSHAIQEQIYHILEGEGLMELDGRTQLVRRHDVVFIPPGVVHALHNTGFQDLVFIVVTTPARDEK